ncbi:MAG TPA: hypothetical protein VH951_07665 [Dehalococcoidia bacterium]
MTPMALAIERRQWDLVALYLLLGVQRAAALLPPETLTELLDLLSEYGPPSDGRRHDR